MADRIPREALDQLFLSARSHNKWLDKDVPDSTLRELVDIMRMGPTSANSSPARVLFVKSNSAKERLAPHLSAANRAKTMTAPACAIIGYDLRFYEHLSRLFPHDLSARSWFEGKDQVVRDTSFRNGTLQGAYLIIAARALGLDCGPMSGFDNAGVDREFFAGTSIRSNFLCSLGYADQAGLFQRHPRLSFDEIAKII